jgi:DNA-binding NtrC family response regulator
VVGQPSAKDSAPAPRRLLIIDDDETLLEALAGIFPLRLPSVIVQTVQSAHAGLQLLQAEHYDLILCDVRMPDKDGLAFLQELARVPFSPPVVLMTAHGDHHSLAQAQRHGATAFIEKPFDREELVTTVARLLGL